MWANANCWTLYTTAVAPVRGLADHGAGDDTGQTKALSLAARVANSPEELPLAVAMLRARIVPPAEKIAAAKAGLDGTWPKTPTAWQGPITFSRPGNLSPPQNQLAPAG